MFLIKSSYLTIMLPNGILGKFPLTMAITKGGLIISFLIILSRLYQNELNYL